jgi:hypothetical protein
MRSIDSNDVRPNAALDLAGEPMALPAVFRREGEYWTIAFAGGVCRLRDGAGLRYLAALLHRPNLKVSAAELIRLAGRQPPGARGGERPRATADAERNRVSVTRAIRSAIDRLAAHHPALVEHLRATIHTGASCAYSLDPRRTIEWEP